MYRTKRIGTMLLISTLILIVFALCVAAEYEQTTNEISKIMTTNQMVYIPPDTIWPPVIIVEPSNIKVQISQQDTMYSQVNVYNYNDLIGTITGGKATKTFTFPNGGNYKIEAIAEKGYKFDKFCDASNKCVTTNPLIGDINSVGDYLTYIAYFKPEIIISPSNIKIQALPASATKSKVNIYKDVTSIGYVSGGAGIQTFTFANGGNYKIEAVPETGYVFDKFCDASNKCVTTNPITGSINPTGNYLTYIGYFKPEIKPPSTIKLQISQKDTLYSKVYIYRNNVGLGSATGGVDTKIYEFANGGNYKIEAVPETGYVFDKFCDASNNCVTTNPITGSINPTGDYLTYIAYFKPEVKPPSTIKIQALPTNAVNSKVNIYNNNVITGKAVGGEAIKTFTFANGGNYKIEAVPETGYVFDKFCDASNKCVTTNPITGSINPTGDYLTYIGYFKPEVKPPSTIKIQALPASAANSKINIYYNNVVLGLVTGGAIAQTFTFANGGSYKIEAVPETGYVFDKFCDASNICVTTNPLTGYVNPTGNYLTYIGHFKTPPIIPPTCDSSYPDFCIPPPPPDLNCIDILQKDFKVLPPDPHGFDADHDGIGCESPITPPTIPPTIPPTPLVNAQRTIDNNILTPDGETVITVAITNDNVQRALSLHEMIPPGWIVTNVFNDADTFKINNSVAEWVWYSVPSNAPRTAKYNVKVLPAEKIGIYNINGHMTTNEIDISVTGDNTISVEQGDILAYYRGLGTCLNTVETNDLLKAADDWRDNIVPPKFSTSLITQQLLTLADEWRVSTQCN